MALKMDDTRPEVSIVLSTFNRREYLCSAIESVLAQTASDWELIIVDDCSEDDPRDLVESYVDNRISFIRQPVNVGIARNVTTGMKAARGAFVTNLHDDDVLYPTYIESLLAGLRRYPEALLAFCDHDVITTDGRIDALASRQRSAEEGRQQLAPGLHDDFVELALVRRVAFLGLGSLWRNVTIDWNYVARSGDYWDNFTLYLLAREGASVVYVASALGGWRAHQGSNTIAGSGHSRPEVKLRTGRSRVICNTVYRDDGRLAPWRPAFVAQIGQGYATMAIAYLRLDAVHHARAAALRSLRSNLNARAAVALALTLLPKPARAKASRYRRRK